MQRRHDAPLEELDAVVEVAGAVTDETVLVTGAVTDETAEVTGAVTDETALVSGAVTEETVLATGAVSEETVLVNGFVTEESVPVSGSVTEETVFVRGVVEEFNKVEGNNGEPLVDGTVCRSWPEAEEITVRTSVSDVLTKSTAARSASRQASNGSSNVAFKSDASAAGGSRSDTETAGTEVSVARPVFSASSCDGDGAGTLKGKASRYASVGRVRSAGIDVWGIKRRSLISVCSPAKTIWTSVGSVSDRTSTAPSHT